MERFHLIWEPSLPNEQYAEDDCACPDEGLTLAQVSPPGEAPRWQTPPYLHRASLPGPYELAFNSVGTSGVVVYDAPVRHILDAFRSPHSLEELPSLVPEVELADASEIAKQLMGLALLVPANFAVQLERTQPRTLNAWLHVTNACNLRCAYCYLAKTGERMDESTGHAAVQAIFRSAVRHGFSAVKIKYAGGEPTLNFPLIQTLHQQVSQLSSRHRIEAHEIILSNGVGLTNRMMDALCEANIALMISLDGIGAAHDVHRHFPNGHGSFEVVVNSIDRALARGLVPQLMITVSKRNAGSLAEVVQFALERNLPFRLNFYRETDGISCAADLEADQASLVGGVRVAFSAIETCLPQRRLIGGLVDRSLFAYPHEHSCAVDHSYLVIDQHGRIARCQMTIGQPVTDVWADDPLQAVRAPQDGFRNLSVDERESCRECAWRYWCAGGCPLLTFRATGRSDCKSPYCDVYRALYPDVLRLEGLRLLRWGMPTD
jgi:uncharacterized protein